MAFGQRSTSFNSYLAHFNESLQNKDGQEMAKILSLDECELRQGLTLELLRDYNQAAIMRYVFAPWDDVILAHFGCCRALFYSNDPIEGFGYKCSFIQAFSKVLSTSKDENWFLPIMNVCAIEIRKLAKAADHFKKKNARGDGKQVKPNEYLEEAAAQLMSLFRICATDNRAAMEVTKRKGMINLINQLFKIYFKINKLNLCKPLIRALDNANMMNQFSLAQLVTYNYFTGMKSLFDSDYKRAEEQLSFAFSNCHPNSFKNQRLILLFLIPVKMLLGHMPTQHLLQKYDLLQFAPVVKAVKEGNLRGLDQALETNSDFFWNYGIFLSLEKLKTIAYRNIFKKVSLMVKGHQIPIEKFVTAINYLEDEEISLEEVHCILANLIYEGKIKGYISLQHQKLVISKQNPFPILSTVIS